MAMAAELIENGVELYAKNLKFVEEKIKIDDELKSTLPTANTALQIAGEAKDGFDDRAGRNAERSRHDAEI